MAQKAVVALLVGLSSAAPPAAILSNVKLPLDAAGEQLITGETSVLQHEGFYYFVRFFSCSYAQPYSHAMNFAESTVCQRLGRVCRRGLLSLS